MNKKIVTEMVLMLVTIGVFAGCVENNKINGYDFDEKGVKLPEDYDLVTYSMDNVIQLPAVDEWYEEWEKHCATSISGYVMNVETREGNWSECFSFFNEGKANFTTVYFYGGYNVSYIEDYSGCNRYTELLKSLPNEIYTWGSDSYLTIFYEPQEDAPYNYIGYICGVKIRERIWNDDGNGWNIK